MKQYSGMIYSAILHLFLLMVAIFGLPNWFKRAQPHIKVVTVELLPFNQITNVQPKKTVKKPTEKQPEASKSIPNSTPEKAKPQATPESTKIDPKAVKQSEPKPKEKQHADKSLEKSKDKPIEKKKKSNPNELDAILKTLEESSVKSEQEDLKQKKQEVADERISDADTNVEGPSNPTIPLSMSEKDIIRSQVEKHWNVPAGAKDLDKMNTVLHVILERDGTVVSVKIAQSSQRFGVDPSFAKSFDESVMRAIKRASPLQNLPVERYNAWREFEYEFAPEGVY